MHFVKISTEEAKLSKIGVRLLKEYLVRSFQHQKEYLAIKYWIVLTRNMVNIKKQ